jgi:hypothetical protein
MDLARVDSRDAEKPTANSNSEGIQQGCFTRSVFTHNQVELRMKGQLSAAEAPEILQQQAIDPHPGVRRPDRTGLA